MSSQMIEEPALTAGSNPSFPTTDEVAPPTKRTSKKPSWKQIGFFFVNLWLVFHLFAIIVCPASVEPSSPLIQSAFHQISPYLHFLYLDHGFHFFAPEPGASTLVSYSLVFPDGSTKTMGRFPNRSISPRLLYHRYFMLTEFLGNGPEELEPLVARAFARNLCRQTGATKVTLTKIEHFPPTVEELQRGLTLNDPSLFRETPLGTFTAEELKHPPKPRIKVAPPAESPEDYRVPVETTKETP